MSHEKPGVCLSGFPEVPPVWNFVHCVTAAHVQLSTITGPAPPPYTVLVRLHQSQLLTEHVITDCGQSEFAGGVKSSVPLVSPVFSRNRHWRYSPLQTCKEILIHRTSFRSHYQSNTTRSQTGSAIPRPKNEPNSDKRLNLVLLQQNNHFIVS